MSSAPEAGNAIFGAYTALAAQAVLPIVLGSFASVKTPKSIKKALKLKSPYPEALDPDDTSSEDDNSNEEQVNFTDSLLFPVFGSCALLGLFFLLKYVGKEWINWFLGIYFGIAGVAAFQTTFSYLLDGIVNRFASKKPMKYHLRFEHGFKEIFHLPLSLPSILLLPISILLPFLYVYLSKPWYLTNVLSFAFAQSAISLLKLDGFKTGGMMLVGLWAYDVFWVFGTPVMVTVAKGIDAPIKVLAPRNMADASDGFTMLGLGDIVIPGIFISLALRYDYSNYVTSQLKKNPDSTPDKSKPYPKPYFLTVLAAYVLGLAVTVGVMHWFKAAQPALLYLSPACIGSVSLVALIQGRTSSLWKWIDEDPTNPSEEDQEDEITKAKKIALADKDNEEATSKSKSIGNSEATTTSTTTTAIKQPEVNLTDEEWMKLSDDDNTVGASGGKGKKKKAAGGGKKKK